MTTINSPEILYGGGVPNNVCFTPAYAVEPLLEFIPKHVKTVWCPYDTETSNYVQVLGQYYNVIYSDTVLDSDFMIHEPDEDWDCIITNPPFQNKKNIFERALSFGKPMALLMSLTWLNDSAPKILFKDKDLQLLMFDKRIKFIGQEQKGITFSSAYFAWNFFPKQIIMKQLVIPPTPKKRK